MPHQLRRIVACLTLAALAAGCQQPQACKESAIDHYVQGQMLADKGDLDAALQELAKAVRNDSTLSIAYAAAGDIYRKRGDLDLAVRSYELACRANPYAFRPHYNLGVTYQLLAEATRQAERLESYLRAAVDVYLRAVTIRPDDFDANLNLAACYFQLGKHDQAEKYARAAAELRPSSPQAHGNLAIIYDAQNKLYDAIREYKASLELDTHQPKLLMNLGATYTRQNRLKSALSVYELAVREDPQSAAAVEALATCHYHLKQYDQAVAHYEKALTLAPRSASAYRGIGVVWMTQWLSDQTRADLRERGLGAWNTSLELDPSQSDLAKLVQKYTPAPTGPGL